MKTFEATIQIKAKTLEQAKQVIDERVYFEEDYGFDYTIQTVEDTHEVED